MLSPPLRIVLLILCCILLTGCTALAQRLSGKGQIELRPIVETLELEPLEPIEPQLGEE